ncbi:baeRF10 domain-containing protein [Amycolatopsis sp. NPDC004378]
MITAETVNRILRLSGDGLPLTSVYVRVPVDPKDRADLLGRLDTVLDQVEPMAKDKSVDRAVRLSLRGDLERMREAVKIEHWRPGSVAFFSCSARDIFEAVQLPRAVRDRAVLDDTPLVRPMLAVLEEYARCCVAVVDRAKAQMWELFADEIEPVGSLSDRKLRKPDYAANLAEDKVHNKAEELAKKHYQHTAAELAELYETDGYDLLAVGGHRVEVPHFLDALPRDLRERVAGTFTVDPHAVDLGEIKQNADAIVARYQRDVDLKLVREVVEKAAMGRGYGVLGVAGCLWAATVKAVETLLVQDGATVAGVVCTNCDWMGMSGDTCPLCEHATRPTADILDELAQAVIDESGAVRHVKADSEIKEHLAGASLRFPLPPLP